MSKLVVIVFPNEVKAYEGTRALKELNAEGSLVLYSEAVVLKDENGVLSVKQAADSGPIGTAVGALTGALVGLLGGPIGSAVGLTGGAVIGSLRDIFHAGVSTEFLRSVSEELAPGKAAVIAEISEEWIIPLDTRVEPLGGVVLRTYRSEFEDEQIEKEIASRRRELDHLKQEYEKSSKDTKAKLKARIDTAKAELTDAVARAKHRAETLQRETEARVKLLERQTKEATTERKEWVKEQVAQLRTSYDVRSAKLKQAWEIAKDALL